MRLVVVVLTGAVIGGCYASHRRIEPREPPCPEDEGILGTGPWRTVPPPAAGTPALAPVGERVVLGLTDTSYVDLAWNGDGFGMIADGRPAFFVELDAHGVPRGAPVEHPGYFRHQLLEYACGHYGVASDPRTTSGVALLALDAAGEIVATSDTHPDAAVVVDMGLSGSDWATVVAEEHGPEWAIDLLVADGDTLVPERSYDIADGAYGPAHLLSDRDGAFVLWLRRMGSSQFAALQRLEDGAPVGAPVEVLEVFADAPVTAILVRDRIVFHAYLAPAVLDHVIVLDRATLREVGRHPVHPRREHPSSWTTLVAAVEEGFVVACTAISGEPRTEVVAIGLDGRPWGEPLEVPTHVRDCFWNGEDLLMLSRDADAGWVLDRARPTFL